MSKICIRDVVEITDDRIIYRDERGDTAFIELAPCSNSFEIKHNITTEAGKVRTVGERFFGENAYYELYDIGHTRLYLKLKTNRIQKLISKVFKWNFHAKEFQLFYSIQTQLNAHGWTTLDLS